MTRHKLVPEGPTTASMPPTVTVATMPILTNTSAVRLAKKILPHSVFRLVSSTKNSHSCCYTNFYLFAYVLPYQKSTNNVWVYSHI
uniref:Uncharacterized protein n=1 Tax=Shewanella putrefaciens (strain CN-32 / ATCC BAA-453) TaxID=319224 RepID=A4Y5W5_SHEPC